MTSSIRSQIFRALSTPEAFNMSATIKNVTAALPHFISLIALITSSSGMWGARPSMGYLYLWESPDPSRTLHLRGAHSAFSRQLAWPSRTGTTASVITDMFLPLDIRWCVCVPFGWRDGKTSELSAEGYLWTSCLAWDLASLLPPFFQVSSTSVFHWLPCRQPPPPPNCL